jgi:hypothetical protein
VSRAYLSEARLRLQLNALSPEFCVTGILEQGAIRGIAGNLITQDIGVVTGLQSKFDWAGVAVAGVAGAISGGIPKAAAGVMHYVDVGLSNGAAAIAGAAARSLLTGTDFGDNVIGALPAAIGNTIGELAAERFTDSGRSSPLPQNQFAQADTGTRSDAPTAVEQAVDEIVITAPTRQHGFWWKVADTLGFHHSVSADWSRTMEVAHSVASTIRNSSLVQFEAGLVTGAYDAGADTIRGTYHLLTTNPITTARSALLGVAGTIDRVLAAENTPASVQISKAWSAVRSASAFDIGHAVGHGGTNAALMIAPSGIAGRVAGFAETSEAATVAAERIGVQSSDPTTISFTQSSVSFQKAGANYSLDSLVESMSTNGWVGKPIDVVSMPDGTLATIDNTRVLAARMSGINVEANVRGFGEVITDPIRQASLTERGIVPDTWGDAALLRINKPIQNATYPNMNPSWSTRYPYGSIYDPVVRH